MCLCLIYCLYVYLLFICLFAWVSICKSVCLIYSLAYMSVSLPAYLSVFFSSFKYLFLPFHLPIQLCLPTYLSKTCLLISLHGYLDFSVPACLVNYSPTLLRASSFPSACTSRHQVKRRKTRSGIFSINRSYIPSFLPPVSNTHIHSVTRQSLLTNISPHTLHCLLSSIISCSPL